MWLSNTATTAMMIPIAHAVLVEMWKKKKSSLSEYHGVLPLRKGKSLSTSHGFWELSLSLEMTNFLTKLEFLATSMGN